MRSMATSSVNGVPRFRGFPVGAEVASGPGGPRSGWDPWLMRADGSRPSRVVHGDVLQAHGDARRELDWRTFDVEKDAAQLRTISTLLNATDPDLAASARGAARS